MRKTGSIIAIIAIWILIGYGLGAVIGGIMKKSVKSPKEIKKSEITIKDGVMTPETLLSLGRLSDPQVSPDGTKVLYGVSYTSIKENRACRQLFASEIDGANKCKLTRGGKSFSCARWSPDGKHIFFVKGGQIYKARFVSTKKKSAIINAKKISDVPNGIGEFALSPDGKKIMYTSTVKGPVTTPKDTDPALDKANAYVATDLMYRHWDHWVTETPRTYLAPTNKKITPKTSKDICDIEGVELPTEPFGGIEQLAWSPDSRYIAYSCRKLTGKEYAFSTNTSIYIYDTKEGTTSAITTTGGYDTDPVWNEDGTKLAFISMARDGYEADEQRLMLANIKDGELSGEIEFLSNGFDHDVQGIVWYKGEIYFSALYNEGIQSIFKYDTYGCIERLTPSDWKCDVFSPWFIKYNEAGVELYTSYYSLNSPVELAKIEVTEEGAKLSQITTENEAILEQLDEPTSESVYITTVDDQEMQAWILYPPHFDENGSYPAIEIVLGGPQSTNSQDWSYRWCYRMMAQQGYIVICPNRRGTTAFGQEWKEQISGDYSGLNMQDYLSAGRYIKSKPYVSKLACVGASYGGFSAYMLEGLHGNLYDCFIAHAGIFDEKNLWYTTEEMWFANWDNGGLTEYAYTPDQTGPADDGITFGGMQQAGAPYADTPKAIHHYKNDPSSMITNWHTPILCIHGGMDFRIPYTQGMAAFNAAQMMGVPSKLIVFPDENHWILQPQNALFWHRNFFDWLDQWCR